MLHFRSPQFCRSVGPVSPVASLPSFLPLPSVSLLPSVLAVLSIPSLLSHQRIVRLDVPVGPVDSVSSVGLDGHVGRVEPVGAVNPVGLVGPSESSTFFLGIKNCDVACMGTE